MSYKHNTPLVIYKNLPEFFEYRMLDLVAGNHVIEKGKIVKSKSRWLTDEEFIKTIQFQGYVLVEAKDSKSRVRKMRKDPEHIRKLPVRTLILIFDDTGKFDKTPDFKKLIASIPYTSPSTKFNLDIITVSRIEPTTHLRKALKTIERPNGDAESGTGYMRFYPRRYVSLCNINPRHVNAPLCRVLDAEEEKQVLATLFVEKRDLPKLFDSDGMSIWYPVEIGDIVEEMHNSESVGLEKIYRVVVPTPLIEKK